MRKPDGWDGIEGYCKSIQAATTNLVASYLSKQKDLAVVVTSRVSQEENPA
jgi:hypothetical protein